MTVRYNASVRPSPEEAIAWQESEAVRLGTDDQRERHAARLLPEHELCHLARGELFVGFVGFVGFVLRRKLTAAAIGHPRRPDSHAWRCASPSLPIPVIWSTLPTPVLTATEWVVLARLNAVVEQTNKHPWLAGSGATIATRIHKGVCQRCHREAAQVSALVTIDWAGRTLSREYLL